MLDQGNVASASPVQPSDRIAEANHRIANSLAVIAGLVQRDLSRLSRHGRAVSVAAARDTLAETKARIEAVARLHRALSHAPGGEAIDAGLYVQQIADELVGSLARSSSVALRFAGEIGCYITPGHALHLGMILTELLTNAVKYAHPTGIDGEILVTCRRLPDGLQVEVVDDGIGFPEDFDPDCDGHTGLNLVRSLATHMGAKLLFHNGALGLRCVVELPTTNPGLQRGQAL